MIELLFAALMVCAALNTNPVGVTDDPKALACYDTVSACVRSKITASSTPEEKSSVLEGCFKDTGYHLPQKERI